MTLRSYLETIATSLGDFDKEDANSSYQHWSLDTLLTWYNEAMCIIATYKPGDFVKTKIMKLQPGTIQLPCCNQVGTAVEFTDARGKHISYLRPLDAKTAVRPWRGLSCITPIASKYVPTNTWKMDGASDSFEIYPPAPEFGNYYVKFRCVQSPAGLTTAELDSDQKDCRYNAPAAEWILFKALSGETDTQLIASAQLHYKAFFDLLGVQVKSMDKFMAQQNTWAAASGYAVGAPIK